jgi:hypothetical protein
MRLEILTPRHWTHPSKNFLRQWYCRIGYAPQTTNRFESMHPELVPELATECDFTVWHKSLDEDIRHAATQQTLDGKGGEDGRYDYR